MSNNSNEEKKVVITGSHVVLVACTLGVIIAVAMLISNFISGEYNTDFVMYLGILVSCGVALYITLQDRKKKKNAENDSDGN